MSESQVYVLTPERTIVPAESHPMLMGTGTSSANVMPMARGGGGGGGNSNGNKKAAYTWMIAIIIIIIFIILLWIIFSSRQTIKQKEQEMLLLVQRNCATGSLTAPSGAADGGVRLLAVQTTTTAAGATNDPPALAAPTENEGAATDSKEDVAGATGEGAQAKITVDIPNKFGTYKRKSGAPVSTLQTDEKGENVAGAGAPSQGKSSGGSGDGYGDNFDQRPKKATGVATATKKKIKLRPAERNVRTFVRYGEKFTIPGSNRQNHLKAEKLLPSHVVKDPNSRLGAIHKKWLEKTKVPTKEQIKQAQRIRPSQYFNMMPSGLKKITGIDMRPALRKPTLPEMRLNQPVESVH